MSSVRGDHILVLAAGRGRRMGVPKALMTVESELWWRTQQARLEEVGAPATWVVSAHVRGELDGQEHPPERFAIADPDKPMFESLLVGLMTIATLQPRGVFVLPVDVPVPKVEVFRDLCIASNTREEPRPAIPTYAGVTGHPVYLPWRWVCNIILPPEHGGRAAPLFGPQRRLDTLLENRHDTVDVVDPTIHINLNTPADVENWLCPGLASD